MTRLSIMQCKGRIWKHNRRSEEIKCRERWNNWQKRLNWSKEETDEEKGNLWREK